ncbi:MAG: formate dehydrogenase accessory protein FdhE [Proteobacteria bacterium]|nr:formate dehydrogenase accessory protein FdhE [Pseudomonadota bacterium]
MNGELAIALERIKKIKADRPVYQELMGFYEKIVKERDEYKKSLQLNQTPIPFEEHLEEVTLKEGFTLFEKEKLPFDYDLMKSYFSKLISLIKERALEQANSIEKMVKKEKGGFEKMITEALKRKDSTVQNPLLAFLLNETINPVMESYASYFQDKIKEGMWTQGYCPLCGSKPFMGVLKGEEGKRYLICERCSSEWLFIRVKCPYCGNEDQKKLSYFVVEDDEVNRVETCEACRKYIKIIDLRKINYSISYYIENIATLHLDMIALEKGYENDTHSLDAYQS